VIRFGRCFNFFSLASQNRVLVLLLLTMSGYAAAEQKPNANPCNIGEAEAAGLNHNLSTDVYAASTYADTIARMFKEEKFEQLDCLADRARGNKERFPGGAWKLYTLYAQLENPPVTHASQEDWEALLARLRNWETARPKSITPRVALARAYLNYAFDARGNGYANTVSDSGWRLYQERTAEAKRILEEAKTLPTMCPEWYTAMLAIALQDGWSVSATRTLFEEAFKFEPGYYYNVRMFSNYLQPHWYGETGDIEKFVQETADRIGGEQGDILYYQAADHLICGCTDQPHLSIERIERGYEASEKVYGVSLLNLNRMAHMASQYGSSGENLDPVFVDKALTRIGDQWDEGTWKTKEDFESIKKWAAQTAPVVAAARAKLAQAQANEQTPEGARYKAAFERTYTALLQECAHSDRSSDSPPIDSGKLEAVTSVATNGAVAEGWINGMGPVAMCMNRKMRSSYQQQSPLFPPPPHAAYWVKIDLDWNDFTSVATK
jgi:uncharacterized protein DUF4034